MIKPGDVIHGFCNGRFGRDSYDPKLVLHVGQVPANDHLTDPPGPQEYIVVSESWWANGHKERFDLVHCAQGSGLLAELEPFLDPNHDDVTGGL